MKRLVYAVMTMVFLVAVYMVVLPKRVPVESVVLKRGEFAETLSSEGKIRSRTKQTIYAFATGNIENIQVKVGDLVTKGQVLGKLYWDNLDAVKSPIDGVISKVHRDSPGPINRGEPIFEVSQLSDLEVVAELLTPDAIRLNPNGEVKILNWGGEGEIPARVAQISRAGSVKTSALGVEEEKTEVRLSFEKIPPELKNRLGDNYHVDVVFLISRESDALAVPLGALFKAGEKWAVYRVLDGRARMAEVAVGKRNDRQALVSQGLSEGDRVILFPGDKIKDGTRIK